MTYVEPGWDVYVCHFLIQKSEYGVVENPDKENALEEVLMEQSHYIECVLFSAESPDSAFDWAVAMVDRLSDTDHGGQHGLRKYAGVGIVDLDNTQTASDTLYREVKGETGFTVHTIDINNIDVEACLGVPEKGRLKLFS